MSDLHELLIKNNGIVTTDKLKSLKLDSRNIKQLTDSSVIEKISRGIYIGTDFFLDDAYVTQLRCTKGIFSFETALYYHNLIDRVPIRYEVTIPSKYNTRLLGDKKYKFHYLKRELYELGIIELKTEFGNTIKVYDPERTICDIIRSKDLIERNLFVTALKNYASSKDRDTKKLYEYAKQFKIEDTVKMYMEVLVWV